MGDRTAIEWTRGDDGSPGSTWNPLRGTKGLWTCTKVSPGCSSCYAERLNVRRGGPAYVVGADTPRLAEHVLTQPLRWKRPRKIFVCSMTDLFEERVHDLWIGRIFGTMAEAYWHDFLVLTKRAERLYDWSKAVMHYPKGDRSQRPVPGWPPNVIVMVSAEDQQRLDERLPWLLMTEAYRRGVSLEPLLGAIDLQRPHGLYYDKAGCNLRKIDWCIVGGESGGTSERALVEKHSGQTKREEWHIKTWAIEWVRSIRDQCVAAGVAFHFKQWGGPTSKSCGRLLDGRTWDEFPQERRT